MINVPVSIGELIDKITILEIKIERMSDETKKKNCRYEHQLLTRIMSDHKISFPDQHAALKKVNEKIWEIEDRMRKAEATQTFGQPFIELTRDEYKFNDLRAKIKKEINLKAGSEIVEEKEYVPYADAL